MNAHTPLLEVRGLKVSFPLRSGETLAVDGLDLTLGSGEMLALVGESGCGKSSVALALLGLLAKGAQVSGSIRLHGRELVGISTSEWRSIRGQSLAMVFQEPMSSLNPVHRIGDQIAEALRCHQALSAEAARRRAIELLDTVRIPEPQRRVDDYPHQLSGGQRQRVMIAMAVACNPGILVADEPTTALDVTVQAQILELIDSLRREMSMAVLLISHDLGLVARWAHRVSVMYAGRCVEAGPTRPTLTAPGHPYTQGLLATSLHCAGATHYLESSLPEIRVSPPDASGGRRFEVLAGMPRLPQSKAAVEAPLFQASGPVLKVENLSIRYASPDSSRDAVNNVSFQIAEGQTVGLVGESGCGKSTLARAVLRLIPARSGRIQFDGKDIGALSRSALREFRRSVQMVFQDPYGSLNPRHTVATILDAALLDRPDLSVAERKSRATRMIERVGLPADSSGRYPNEFSGGQRQRIGIARALMVEPRLLVLDEPVSALDVSVQAQILNLLVDLKRDLGLSYLFISHDLAVIRYMADAVIVMREGRLVEAADQKTFWSSAETDYARSLIAAAPGPDWLKRN